MDMVRFTIYLELMERDSLVEMASENGEYLLSCLSSLQDDSGDVITNVRGKGLFCAYDLPTSDHRDKLITNMEAEGAIILGCGHRSIRFRPHLNISKNEIDQGMSMMKSALSKL